MRKYPTPLLISGLAIMAAFSAPNCNVPTTGNHITFVAVGDAGTNPGTNNIQQSVADAMATVCAAEGCDFALVLGDNFYNCGVDPDTGAGPDTLWDTRFNDIYSDPALDMPFYAVPGNHDYWGKDTNGNCDGMVQDYVPERATAQVQYTLANYPTSTNFNMPWLPSYSMVEAHDWVEFFPLDTHRIALGMDDDGNSGASIQWTNTADRIANSTANFKIAFGHHPYLSNGSHGNAGSHNGNPVDPLLHTCDPSTRTPDTTIAKQASVCFQDYMEENVCDKVDLYFSGHDHNQQYLNPVPSCGSTAFVVSGAGGKGTTLTGSNATFGESEEPGFVLVKICGTLGRLDELTMYDQNAAIEYQYSHPDAANCPMEMYEKEELKFLVEREEATNETTEETVIVTEIPVLTEGFETKLTKAGGCTDTTLYSYREDGTIALTIDAPDLFARAAETGSVQESYDLSQAELGVSLRVDLGTDVQKNHCTDIISDIIIDNTYQAVSGKLTLMLKGRSTSDDLLGSYILSDVTLKDEDEHTVIVESLTVQDITVTVR
jgi:tartrate-resistant acid phosphatase type 5